MHPASAACATPPFMGGARRDISVRIMIRCSRRIGGPRTFGFWRSTKSRRCPMCPCHTPLWERLIGTMRRECLDHVLCWNAVSLERKLADFQAYYNAARSHASWEGYTPLGFAGERTAARAECNHVRWISHCRGMVQLPAAA